MFRITRGLSVQHVHFPFSLLGRRELDEDEEMGAGIDLPRSAPPPTALTQSGGDAEKQGTAVRPPLL